jgi:AraC-like DNA-binding protein
MVSLRCKLLVKEKLNKLGIEYSSVDLGEVELPEDITDQQKLQLKLSLAEAGLELMDDRKKILIEKIKAVVVEMVHYGDEFPTTNFSDYISEKLHYDYTYLANLFSEVKGTTLEHFVVAHKIERVKELLIYDELNLTEIAYKLNYSSVAHLSNQFKKITGLTPSFFKKMKDKRRRSLEDI